MASAPVVTSPPDYSTQGLPYTVTGTSDGKILEARDDAGLLLPATQNPADVVAGGYSIQITGSVGNRGAVYGTGTGEIALPPAGISDNFNRADGALGANWTAVPGNRAVEIVSNRASRTTVEVWGTEAVWAGSPQAGADQTVVGQVSAAQGKQAAICARHSGQNNGTYISAEYKSDDGVDFFWIFQGLNGGSASAWGAHHTTTEKWAKIVVAGSTATFYTSTDGATWTQRYQLTDAVNFPASGQPALRFPNGTDGGTSVWIDAFSASSP